MKTQEQDIRAIEQLAADWRAGWHAGNVDALLALYADEPVLMPQGQPAVNGKPAIRRLYAEVFAHATIESESMLMEVETSGDWGYFWSVYKLRAIPKTGGPATQAEGKSLFVVKRARSGAWKISRLIDNSSCH